MQHGDTNAQNFTCITGNRTGNHAEVENGEVFELDQKASPIELAFEI